MSYPGSNDTVKTFTGTLDLQDGNGPRYGKYEERTDAYGASYWHYVGDTRAPAEPRAGSTPSIYITNPESAPAAISTIYDSAGRAYSYNELTGTSKPIMLPDGTQMTKAGSGGGNTPTNPKIYEASGTPTGYVYGPTGQVVNWDGSPYNGPGYTDGRRADAGGDDRNVQTWSGGGNLYERDPKTGKWGIAISGPGPSGGSSAGSGLASLARDTANNAAKLQQIAASAASDQANIAARAQANAEEMALRYGYETEQAREARAAAAAESALDRKLRVSLAKVDFEQWRTGMSIQAQERQLAAAKTLSEVIGQVDPNAYRAFLEAGGMNIANAIAGGGNAVSEAGMLPAARALRTAETPIKIPTFEEAFPDSASWMAGQSSGGAVPVPGGNASPTGATNGATTVPVPPPPPAATAQGGGQSTASNGANLAAGAGGGLWAEPTWADVMATAQAGMQFDPEYGDLVDPSLAFAGDISELLRRQGLGGTTSAATQAAYTAPSPAATYNAFSGGDAVYDPYKRISGLLAVPPPKTLLPGQSIPIDNGVGGGEIDLTRRNTVPMLAGGGPTTAPMMLVGEQGPELIRNPMRGPLDIVPSPETQMMLRQGMRVPGYWDGTDFNLDNFIAEQLASQQFTQQQQAATQPATTITAIPQVQQQTQQVAVPPPAPAPAPAASIAPAAPTPAPSAPVVPQPTFANTSPVPLSSSSPAATTGTPVTAAAPVVSSAAPSAAPTPAPAVTGPTPLTAEQVRLNLANASSNPTAYLAANPVATPTTAAPVPLPLGVGGTPDFPGGYTPTPKPPGTVGYTGAPSATGTAVPMPGPELTPAAYENYKQKMATYSGGLGPNGQPITGMTPLSYEEWVASEQKKFIDMSQPRPAAVPPPSPYTAPSPLTASQPAGIPASTVLPPDAISAADIPYIDRIRQLRETSPISRNWNPYDVTYGGQDPMWRQVNEQAFQTKFGVPVQSLLAEAARFGIPSANRRGVVMAR